jgi:hypothetical protein
MIPMRRATRRRPDRAAIRYAWIEQVIAAPDREARQHDGRIRLWKAIDEAGGRYLRVVLLADRLMLHNAFFDRGFRA